MLRQILTIFAALLCITVLLAGANRIGENFYRSDAFFPILDQGSFDLSGELSNSAEYYGGPRECGFTLIGFATLCPEVQPESIDRRKF
ncbi:MAG: hypothetical protein II943_11355 [Victivallales bacterium]|nr:hypothetical protein [Victivallales bacterium]